MASQWRENQWLWLASAWLKWLMLSSMSKCGGSYKKHQ
jgi:hypothetical protein